MTNMRCSARDIILLASMDFPYNPAAMEYLEIPGQSALLVTFWPTQFQYFNVSTLGTILTMDNIVNKVLVALSFAGCSYSDWRSLVVSY